MRPGRILPGTAVVLIALVTLAGAGTAFADWLGSGGGSGTGATGTPQAVTLSPATAVTQVHPGAQADVAVTVANPNQANVRVGSLALDTSQGSGGFAVDGAHSACGLSSLAFAPQTNGGSGWTIPGGKSVSVTLSNSLSMSTGANDTCQGAMFTVYLKAGP